MKKPRTMKRYKPKNQTYATAFKVLLSVNHHLIIEFTEGTRWHKVALDHGVMHWFEEVDEFANLPKSVKEIDGRGWFINEVSQVVDAMDFERVDADNNCLSTKERAEAFLALMQLVELRDAWNESPVTKENRYAIIRSRPLRVVDYSAPVEFPRVLEFTSEKLAKEFLEQFRDLIETAKELI